MRSPPCGCEAYIEAFETADQRFVIIHCPKHAAVDELIAALLEYGDHKPNCLQESVYMPQKKGKECTCGYEEALRLAGEGSK